VRLGYSDAEEAFRRDLRAWLDANPPPPPEPREAKHSSAHMPDWARTWQRTLYDHGWLVPGWPPELGGRNASPVEQMIYFEELAARDIPRSFNPQGLSIVTPSIVDHGTPEQHERWAVPTLRGDITWCLGMSEPNAGSDLAGLRTRAVIDGDHFVVDGQKVWTSGAHDADWCLCFVRTDPDAPKHQGISALIVDMRSPGIECRPLPELTGPEWADFNEVFFTGVVVPRDNLLGGLHQGWPITRGSLAHERRMLWISSATAIQRAVDAVAAQWAATAGPDGRPLVEDARLADRLADLYVDAQAMTAMGYRGFARANRGRDASEHMLLKMFGSEVERRLCLVAGEALGPDALDRDRSAAMPLWRDGSWFDQYLRSFAGTIAGGTSEIQRNIVAERVLGLPRG
jgi:alkylation response protein AidB-like acyl-CoA dehydrogenase